LGFSSYPDSCIFNHNAYLNTSGYSDLRSWNGEASPFFLLIFRILTIQDTRGQA